jgi:hypothetical protein
VRRLIAIVVAAGLVVGAWYLRRDVIEDRTGSTGHTPSLTRRATPTLLCATEVAAACDRLEHGHGVRIVAVEPPADIAQRFTTALTTHRPLPADGWLVARPWPGMVGVLAGQQLATSSALARSPLQLVTTRPGPAALTACAARTTWRCVTQLASADPKVAHDPPSTTPGLLSVAGVADGLLGRDDYASNDLDDDQFASDFGAFERSVVDARLRGGTGGGLERRIQIVAGAYSAVTALATTIDLAPTFEAITPSPEITADVVLAGRPDLFDDADIRDALLATGWWRSDDKRLSRRNGLPKPGVMVALRSLTSQVAPG